jgi:hypothetical protein
MLVPKERPPFVYKYGSAERISQILRDMTFYFCSALALNDLFEFRARSIYVEDTDSKYPPIREAPR